jgi:hypothetical protein
MGFWGAKNLSLMTLIVPVPIPENRPINRNGLGLRRTEAIRPPHLE